MSVIFTSLEARPFGFNAGFLFEHRVINVLSGLLYHFIVTVLLLCAYCLGSALESVDIIGKGLFFLKHKAMNRVDLSVASLAV